MLVCCQRGVISRALPSRSGYVCSDAKIHCARRVFLRTGSWRPAIWIRAIMSGSGRKFSFHR
jgi:hypothetical protein